MSVKGGSFEIVLRPSVEGDRRRQSRQQRKQTAARFICSRSRRYHTRPSAGNRMPLSAAGCYPTYGYVTRRRRSRCPSGAAHPSRPGKGAGQPRQRQLKNEPGGLNTLGGLIAMRTLHWSIHMSPSSEYEATCHEIQTFKTEMIMVESKE